MRAFPFGNAYVFVGGVGGAEKPVVGIGDEAFDGVEGGGVAGDAEGGESSWERGARSVGWANLHGPPPVATEGMGTGVVWREGQIGQRASRSDPIPPCSRLIHVDMVPTNNRRSAIP